MIKDDFFRIYEQETGYRPDKSPLSASLLKDAHFIFYPRIANLCRNNPYTIATVFDILALIKPLREQEVKDKVDRRKQTKAEYNEKRRTSRYMHNLMKDTLAGPNFFQEVDRNVKFLSRMMPNDEALKMAFEMATKDDPKMSMDLTPFLKPMTSKQSENQIDCRPTKENTYFNRAIYEIYEAAEKTVIGQSKDSICVNIAKVLESLRIFKAGEDKRSFDRREIRRIIENHQ